MRRTKSVATACQLGRRFTLVEILIVVAIMGILMFIGLPAFEKLVKGTGAELASRNVASKIGMARSYAITTRQYVAVLMPTDEALGSGTNKLPNDYIYKGLKLCVVSANYTSGTPNTFTFKRWVPSEKWDFLPTGTSIIGLKSTLGYVNGDETTYPDIVDDVDLYEIDRTKYSDETATHAHGVHSPVATGKCVTHIRAIVFKPTGKLVGSSPRYVTVGESTYNGSTLVHTGSANRIDIKIDQYTGKTTLLTTGME
ncbi:MAG TPA: hypothetical protein DCZ94_00480 [Lentisphaeria bacterium]|nr:MAG: hypothetical protein A2X48_12040 [Lentisphaerae bacterium GWF2_49_21]HBC85407.1 hypothetical protein [Lentisphaeria bacterium]